ncbi:MAG TPA: glycerol-3-phosphate acyltransferase, partial [Methylomirabilota bacterium]|nr:glycerol-3-phosphate acyltransferase [Methylomirabilota bacterium]
MSLLAGVVAAYLIGAIPIGVMVARAFGVVDLRGSGSGNIGATNVLRSAGRAAALLTLGGDVAKGYLAVSAGAALAGATPLAGAAAAVAAIAGNCWSPFLLFRGGKGMATGLGAFLRLVPLATLPAILVWLVVALTFRYASLASLMAALCVPLGALALGYPVESIAATAAAAAIVY